MINLLRIASKQFSEFEKDKIMACNDCRQSLCDIAKKLNHHHSSINILLKNYKKTGNFYQTEGQDNKRKIIVFTTKGTLTTIIKENNHF